VLADPDEVLRHHLPNLLPHKANASHVQVSYLNHALQTELARVSLIRKLGLRDLAEVFNERDNSHLVQVDTVLEDNVDLCHGYVLGNQL